MKHLYRTGLLISTRVLLALVGDRANTVLRVMALLGACGVSRAADHAG